MLIEGSGLAARRSVLSFNEGTTEREGLGDTVDGRMGRPCTGDDQGSEVEHAPQQGLIDLNALHLVDVDLDDLGDPVALGVFLKIDAGGDAEPTDRDLGLREVTAETIAVASVDEDERVAAFAPLFAQVREGLMSELRGELGALRGRVGDAPTREAVRRDDLVSAGADRRVDAQVVADMQLVGNRLGLVEESPHSIVPGRAGGAFKSSWGLAVTGGLAPNQRPMIARLGIKALVAGSLSNLMSAALAGLFLGLQ